MTELVMDTTENRIVCSAVEMVEPDVLLLGVRHWDHLMHRQFMIIGEVGSPIEVSQGFIDKFGVYRTREEAYEIAQDANQFISYPIRPGTLFSEDVW